MRILHSFIVIFFALTMINSVASAAESINLYFNSSTHVKFNRSISRISVGSDNIITVRQLSGTGAREIIITALEKTGSTTVFVWTVDGTEYEFIVTVYDDQRGEAAIIEREIGLPNVHVRKVGGRVLLQGTVENEDEHQHALRIAQLFAGGETVTTNIANGIERTQDSADDAKGNIIDNLQVLHPYIKSRIEVQIERLINLPNVSVKKIGEKILLQGAVENEDEHQHVLNIAAMFLSGDSSSYTSVFETPNSQSRSERRSSVGAAIVDEIRVLNPYSKTEIETQIEQAINLPNVQVKKIGNSVMLTGTVNNDKEHIHAVQVATVFANNADIENNRSLDNNVKVMTLDLSDVYDANVSKINIVDRIEVLDKRTILEGQIEEAIGLPDVHVKKVEGRILLTGTVKNQYERNYAIQVARLFIGGGSESSLNFGSNVDPSMRTKSSSANSGSTTLLANDDKVQDSGDVIDLLEMLNPLKIRLEAQIVEINSDKARDFGITYGESGSGGVFSMGESNNRTNKARYYRDSNGRMQSETYSDPTAFRHNPITWMEQRFGAINTTIHALVSDGKARILSRPSVTTLSGEQALIQIGGKIPYQSYSENGVVDTKFEDYGIILQLKPIVDAQNRVVTTVHTEVSNLSGQSVNGQPIISTRLADSVISLDSGSTMIIGGLMDSSESKAVSKVPLLGNIPILGEFFKYTSKRRDKRELIILVTPYIVEEPSRAGMSSEMRDYYHAGQRDKLNMSDIDLNESPPPLPDKHKKPKSENKKRDTVIFGDAF